MTSREPWVLERNAVQPTLTKTLEIQDQRTQSCHANPTVWQTLWNNKHVLSSATKFVVTERAATVNQYKTQISRTRDELTKWEKKRAPGRGRNTGTEKMLAYWGQRKCWVYWVLLVYRKGRRQCATDKGMDKIIQSLLFFQRESLGFIIKLERALTRLLLCFQISGTWEKRQALDHSYAGWYVSQPATTFPWAPVQWSTPWWKVFLLSSRIDNIFLCPAPEINLLSI